MIASTFKFSNNMASSSTAAVIVGAGYSITQRGRGRVSVLQGPEFGIDDGVLAIPNTSRGDAYAGSVVGGCALSSNKQSVGSGLKRMRTYY